MATTLSLSPLCYRFGDLLQNASSLPASPLSLDMASSRSGSAKSMFQSTALRRFQSMPVPSFCGFEDTTTPEVCHTKSKLCLLPTSPCSSPMQFQRSSPVKTSLRFGDDDDSQDSGVCVDAEGFSLSQPEKMLRTDFRFAAPLGRAPARRVSRALSDETNNLLFSPGSSCPRPFSLFEDKPSSPVNSPVKLRQSSLTSTDDDDDGFLELADVDDFGSTSDAPKSLSGLFTKPLLAVNGTNSGDDDTPRRRAFSQDSMDDQENRLPAAPFTTFGSSSKRGLFRSPSCPRALQRKSVTFCGTQTMSSSPLCPNVRQAKRTEPADNHCGVTPTQPKRRKSVVGDSTPAGSLPSPLVGSGSSSRTLQRCHSVALIESAMLRRENDPTLIGDLSDAYSLPLCRSKHQDLKGISGETIAALIRGDYSEDVEHIIIDARYPYEYEGGHFKGALNLWHKQAVLDKFMNPGVTNGTPGKKLVIVFHCEFSSERGPRLCRFLRNKDRDANRDNYPALNYPELYLLEGGYKAYFHSQDKNLCEPNTYMPMDHPEHHEDLRTFRATSKSLSSACEKSGRKGRVPFRPSLKL